MTAETDLLPLPDVKCWRAMKDRNGNVGYSDKPDPKYSESAGTDGLTWVRLNDHRAAMQSYARACVSSATEALQAEIESRVRELRAETDRANAQYDRAERLAEALREARVIANQARVAYSGDHSSGTFRAIFAKIDAALEQEATNG